MATDNSDQICQLVERQLAKQNTDYLTVGKVVKGSTGLRALLGLPSKFQASDARKRLELHLSDRFRIYKGSRSIYYVGYEQPDAAMVVNTVRRYAGRKTLGQLATLIPLKKDAFVAALNKLMEEGQVYCRFNKDYRARPFSAQKPHRGPVVSPQKVDETIRSDDDYQAFRDAYDAVGQGNDFVRIHKIRGYLGWTRERFDQVLTELRAAYRVDLHLGDPSHMTREEEEDSFEDQNSILYSNLSWRE